MNKSIGLALAAGYVFTIWLANWLLVHVGIVHVGWGLVAPAGVFAAGAALTLRDLVQRTLGRRAVVAAIIVGAALSYIVSPAFALASGAAFLISELADMAVYTPLEQRNWPLAIVASNIVGLFFDSLLFLWLSPLPVHGLLAGQIVGKAWMTLAAIVVLVPLRRWIPERVPAEA